MALGFIRIGGDEVGIIEKKFGSPLSPGQLIALNGEAGYQADILAPGVSFRPGIFDEIHRVPVINIPQGEIGLVVAKDGQPMSSGQRLGRVVECDDFQDARAFLENGGQKGQQLTILTPGTHKINTALFTVITAANATENGMSPEQLKVTKIESGKIGIITTKDGKPFASGEIAGKIIDGHNKFQNPQIFLDKGGCRGLQEEILSDGDWNLNPWFLDVEEKSLTTISPGTVGVVVSYVGKTLSPPSNEPVEKGYKGIWKEPLYPGQYPINDKAMNVVIVPTHQITIVWSNKPKPDLNISYDWTCEAIKLRSQDGFAFNTEVTQLITILGEDAPKMLSRIGSPDALVKEKTGDSTDDDINRFIAIKYFVGRILEPMVGNYFRISAQEYKVEDFHKNRKDRQQDAEDFIKDELKKYYVLADNTFINDIDLPPELEDLLKIENTIDRKIILEDKKAQLAQKEAITNIQQDYVQLKFDEAKKLQELQFKRADESLRLEILGREIDLMGGFHNRLAWEKVQKLPEVKLPNVLLHSNESNARILEAFIEPMLDTSSNILPPSSQPLPQLESSPPRCPVILLLDTSNSLSTEYLNRLHQGLDNFKNEIIKNDTANRSIEITTISFGGSANVVQSSVRDKEFTTPSLHLGGSTAIGQGLEKALKILDSNKTRYQRGNIQYLTPWVFLITGSIPQDNFQEVASKIQNLIQQKQLNLIVIGIPGADRGMLSQLTSNPYLLQDFKFKPLFYWMANLVKGMPKKYFLSELAATISTIEKLQLMTETQAKTIENKMEQLITEASKDRPSRSIYSPIVGELRKEAMALGDAGKPILDLIPLITQTLEFS